jgi:hypothetical protein
LKNCRRWCGLITPQHPGQRVLHCLNYCNERKQCYPRRSGIRASG